MNTTANEMELTPRRAVRGLGIFERGARAALFGRLRMLRAGCLRVVDAYGETVLGGHGDVCDRPRSPVTITVHDSSIYPQWLTCGTVAAGRTYAEGRWDCDDLTALVRLFLRNRTGLDTLDAGPARLTAPLRMLGQRLRRNTRAGARRNIAAHYDLGNDFFDQFLDPTLTYSCAWFERPDMTLEQAQIAKLDRICRKLDLRPGERVLEIGTGWGGFARHAASRYGCSVTTTTISREQHALATARVRDAGLADRVSVEHCDYRDLAGRYDKLVSIEMIEAVGHEYYPGYFRKCSELLCDEGLMLLQAITIADQRYARARRDVDFIQAYIFPGAGLPSVSVIADCVARSTDMRIVDLDDIGPHYATTLRHWRSALLAHGTELSARGYERHLQRLWEFYFSYCEGGFEERVIGDVQIVLAKPGNRRPVLT